MTFVCFRVFFVIFFWLRVLDKSEYSAFESTLNCSIETIVSYHIKLDYRHFTADTGTHAAPTRHVKNAN